MAKRRLRQLTLYRKAQANNDVADQIDLNAEEELAKDKLRTWLQENNIKFHPQLGLKKLKALKKEAQDSNK